jgi:hypothetical protein
MPAVQEEPHHPPAADLIAVIDAFHAMWNTHDLDGVLSFFTDDAVIIMVRSPREVPDIDRGTAAIQDFVRAYLLGAYVHARSHLPVDSERVVWMSRVSVEWLRRVGIDWSEWKAEAVLRGGKIVR